mgnify:FL=1
MILITEELIRHQSCYMENKTCSKECEEVREQLDRKYAEMNRR